MSDHDDCTTIAPLLDRERAGEPLTPAEGERLLAHLEACADCSRLFELLGELRRAQPAPEPSAHELARMRRAVLAAGRRPAAPPRVTLARWAAAAGVAAALAGGGYLAGRAAAFGEPRTADLLGEPARRAGYRFTAARLEELDGGRLRLGFDVARRVELEVDRDDPLVVEVLVQSLSDPPALGERLRAVESAAARIDPRVRRALTDVMRRDESVAVRLAAQEELLAVEPDAETAAAFLDVLEREPSVQMRLAAVDYLARQGVAPARLADAIAAGPREGAQAVYVQAESYLSGRAPVRGAS